MTEKNNPHRDKSLKTSWFVAFALVVAFIALLRNPIPSSSSTLSWLESYGPGTPSEICKQVTALSPTNKQVEDYVRDKVGSAEYQREIIEKLSGIIQIPSESYDDLGPIGEDDRWDIFFQVEDYLIHTYPTVFQSVKLDHANTHGLILTWKGSVPPSEAKPILLLAHQDVVPVVMENVKDWTHSPYDGHYDGEIIWGRGATDDKGYLISIIESLDLLIRSGFRPKRTVILAFGCDEEISGENCGRPISNFLLEQYGHDGIYLIMDEGSTGIQREFDRSFAMVGVAEKGYLDVGINVSSTGGHASNPPDHNAIGILSEIVVAIESNPFLGKVTPKNPMFHFLECAAVYATESSFPMNVRRTLSKAAAQDNTISQEQLDQALGNMRYHFKTSQSVGKINGGVKINAIPETAFIMVNLRLAVETSIAQVEAHYESLVRTIAKKHKMAFNGFHSPCDPSVARKICLFGVDALEPAPVSSIDAESFRILSGTIKNVLRPLGQDDEVIVTPYLMPANTDTKFFWALTKNIYRFTPVNLVENLNRAHTTDEFIRADEFVREPLFFATLILNADDLVS
jgi:Gly-Xaa carboxypeptidase